MNIPEEREPLGPLVSLWHKHNSCLCVVCPQNILSILTRLLSPYPVFILTVSLPPKVSFLFPSINRTVVATDFMYSAILWWQGPGGRKGRPPAGGFPHVSVWRPLEPSPGPCLQINEKVFQKDGRARRGAPVSTSLKSLNCCTSSWLHSKGSGSSSTSLEIVFLYYVLFSIHSPLVSGFEASDLCPKIDYWDKL